MDIRREIQGVHVSDYMKDYVVDLVHRTREHKLLRSGASPRASRCLYQGAKSYAAIDGRDYVTPEDVQYMAAPVLAHRLILSPEARMRNMTAERVLSQVIGSVQVPVRTA